MSGTSLDALDLAVVQSDGAEFICAGEGKAYPFPEALRDSLLRCQGKSRSLAWVSETERQYSLFVSGCINDFIGSLESAWRPDYIGLHGQTIEHRPEDKVTVQLGCVEDIANTCQLPIIYDFRSNDVMAGGQGAPLAPAYHRALAIACEVPLPVAFVNIGGIANITWWDAERLIAFDCGLGSALMDDVVRAFGKGHFDNKGEGARQGKVNKTRLQEWLALDYFARPYPKSLHREDFHMILEDIGDSPDFADYTDFLATLCEFTACGIARAWELLPQTPKIVIICGGGRRNVFLMQRLKALCPCPLIAIDELNYDGDLLEAQAFAYLALRHIYQLPISWPTTTGVPTPLNGGKLQYPSKIS